MCVVCGCILLTMHHSVLVAESRQITFPQWNTSGALSKLSSAKIMLVVKEVQLNLELCMAVSIEVSLACP